MIERHKKIIIGTTIYLIATYLIAFILVVTLKRPDIFGIAGLVSALAFLLFINSRAVMNLKYRFKEEYLSKRERVKKTQEFKESQRILWISLLIMTVLAVIICFVVI